MIVDRKLLVATGSLVAVSLLAGGCPGEDAVIGTQLGGCHLGGVCEDCAVANCLTEVDECCVEEGCFEIIVCALSYDCDQMSCYTEETCKQVIDDAGGVTSAAVAQAAKLTACANEHCEAQCGLGSGGGGGAGGGGAGGASPGSVACPDSSHPCDVSVGQVCCIEWEWLDTWSGSCDPGGSCGVMGQKPATCDGPEDCPGQICCAMGWTLTTGYSRLECRADCSAADQHIVCDDTDDCLNGGTCQAADVGGNQYLPIGYEVCRVTRT